MINHNTSVNTFILLVYAWLLLFLWGFPGATAASGGYGRGGGELCYKRASPR